MVQDSVYQAGQQKNKVSTYKTNMSHTLFGAKYLLKKPRMRRSKKLYAALVHSIPSRSKTKRKQRHSLATDVASNRASAKKTLRWCALHLYAKI